MTRLATIKRPDLLARRAAAEEAEAALRLVQANRYGNISFGPIIAVDPTNIITAGGRFSVPLPCFNTKRGEIMKAQTDATKIQFDIPREFDLRRDPRCASRGCLAWRQRMAAGRSAYENDVVPNLLKAKQEVEKLYANNDPSVDLAKVLSVERIHLKALETLLDARFETSQAEADLALAVGEPLLALGPQAGLAQGKSAPTPANSSIQPVRAVLGTPTPAASAK